MFSNVSSNRQPDRRQNHTGCICWSFLHHGFSNVSSKHLHKRMHNHTGCICLTFPHCAFSNVSSNCLLEKMHSHIGCICLAFLRCVYSNVSSNGLYKRKHSYIGCTYVTFSQSLLPFSLEVLHCPCFYSNLVVQNRYPSPVQHGRRVVSSINLFLNWRQKSAKKGCELKQYFPFYKSANATEVTKGH